MLYNTPVLPSTHILYYYHMKLKYIRKKLHLTQQQFADRINVARYLISNYEHGHVTPRQSTLEIINTTFGLKKMGIDPLTRRDFGVDNSVIHEYD